MINPKDKARYFSILRQFNDRKVLVVGDVMLDEFIWGTVSRISPEAPVPVVLIRQKSVHLGGSANVACNLHALGATPIPVGIIGAREEDPASGTILREYRRISPVTSGLIAEKSRRSTVKTRIIAHHQQVCRMDAEDTHAVLDGTHRRLLQAYRRLSRQSEATIVSDYAKGVMHPCLSDAIQEALGSGRQKVLSVDPKVRDLSLYGRPTVLTPNKAEAEASSGIRIADEASLMSAGRKILEETGAENLIITRGEEGMSVFTREGQVKHIPTMAREVFDVTGAGDTVIATVTLSLLSGASIFEAAAIANYAAGIVVGKLGTATASTKEIMERISAGF